MGKYKYAPVYIKKLELLKEAHNMIAETIFTQRELPKHHQDTFVFLVFRYEKYGIKLEFKCKDNPDGVYLYYMKLLE